MSDSTLSTQERVIKAIGNVVSDNDIQIDSTFEELGVDSLAAIEILFEVEEEFDLDISGDSTKMTRIKTVRDVADGIDRLLSDENVDFWGDDPSAAATTDGAVTENAVTENAVTENAVTENAVEPDKPDTAGEAAAS